jgi:class 3 adenylate cyclase/HAMP domain-containing protein
MASGFKKMEDETFKKSGLSLGARIFSLSLALLVCLMGVVSFSLYRLSNVRDGIDRLNDYWFPLVQVVSKTDEAILTQRLSFERLIKLYAFNPQPAEQIAQEKQTWTQLGHQIDSLITFANQIPPAVVHESDQDHLSSLVTVFEQIATRHKTVQKQAQQIIALLAEGRQEEAQTHIEVLEKDEGAFERTIEKRQQIFETAFRNAAHNAAQHESQVLRVNALVTLGTVLFGLFFAILIATKLTAPIRQLMAKMRDVGNGNLEVHLQPSSRDEIGFLTNSFNNMVDKLKQKSTIEQTFGKYVDTRIVERLMERNAEPQTVGKNQVMTVLFQDVVGFKAFAQHLSPEDWLIMTNKYLTHLSKPVTDHGGIIDKFIDTMVMAFWGMPFTNEEDHAHKACECALAQITLMQEVHQWISQVDHAKDKTPPIALQIGLATGPLVVGNMGSEQAKSYTVMGDTVNIASRLKGANKVYGTQVLMTEETQQMASEHMITREIDLIQAVGKDEPVRIYELLGRTTDSSNETTQLKTLFHEGVVAYRAQDWHQAQTHFERCLHLRPTDTPSKVYLERISAFQKTPPQNNWDGVWQLTQK